MKPSANQSTDFSEVDELLKQVEDLQATQKKMMYEQKKLKKLVQGKNEEIVQLCEQLRATDSLQSGEYHSAHFTPYVSIESEGGAGSHPATGPPSREGGRLQFLQELDDCRSQICHLIEENAVLKETVDKKHKREVDLENRLDQATKLEPMVEHLTMELSKYQHGGEELGRGKRSSGKKPPQPTFEEEYRLECKNSAKVQRGAGSHIATEPQSREGERLQFLQELDDCRSQISRLMKEKDKLKETVDKKHKRVVDLENRLDQATLLEPMVEQLTMELSKYQLGGEELGRGKRNSGKEPPQPTFEEEYRLECKNNAKLKHEIDVLKSEIDKLKSRSGSITDIDDFEVLNTTSEFTEHKACLEGEGEEGNEGKGVKWERKWRRDQNKEWKRSLSENEPEWEKKMGERDREWEQRLEVGWRWKERRGMRGRV